MAADKAPAATIAWDLPAGWTEQMSDNPTSMRYATLTVGDGDQQLETSVIPLGGGAGGPEANVQRWRAQLNLAPATEAELKEQMKPFAGDGGTQGWLVDLVGAVPDGSSDPPNGMLAAIISTTDRTWFFKAMGPRPVLDRYREAFNALCQSVRFDRGGDE
jgi:hypothetical protein